MKETMKHKDRQAGRQGRENRRKGRIRPAFAAVLSVLLVMSMSIGPAFATGDDPPTSQEIQAAAGVNGNTATVTLGKILTTNTSNRFPGITDFVFSIEAVEGWANANTSTAASGADIAVANMPMPQTSATAHQSVTNSGTKSWVLVGNFQDSTGSNRDSAAGADTTTRRTRTTPVNITFTNAGYYVYKVKEEGSIPNNTASDYMTAPVKNVKGVDYDNNEYFMVFYVCNKVDASGNTTGGVYVHSITSYTNTSGDDTYMPDLSDIRGTTDNNGDAAGANTGSVGVDGTVSHNLGKVGVSDPTTPNQLEAYRMWSDFVSHDVVVKKNVTGNLGDRTKLFEFTITLTGLAPGGTYVTNQTAADGVTAGTAAIDSVSTGTKNSGTSFTATAAGAATLLVKMADDGIFVLNELPMTAQYTVSEAASDHEASYTVTSSNQAASGNTAVIGAASGTNGSSAETALATGTESVDRYDDTVTVLFTNNRDLATITGVPGMDYMAGGGALLLLLLAAAGIIRRRRRYAAEDVLG